MDHLQLICSTHFMNKCNTLTLLSTTGLVYAPAGVLTTIWGGGGGEANAHYIFMKAIYLRILFLYDSSLETVA